VAMGAEEIEFDLWYTKDGEIVSIHDSTLDRVSNGHGKVYEHTYEELLSLDFGAKYGEAFAGMKILRFEEILQKLSCHVIMNIHIKPDRQEPYDRALFQKILDLIDRYDCRKYVYFMAANDYVLALAQEMAPDIARCVGHDGHPENMIDRALKYGCTKIQWYRDQFDQAMIDRARALGIVCNVFYADTPEKCDRYLAMGMDTILTNDYNRISQIVERFRK
ncbi:MAG: hypothetical protein J6W14_00530, partial [Clostridia bacterium]|nr:hypothetical protein [Clostridia bacterium]